MFTNLLFVILVLLLINFSFEIDIKPWIESPQTGFLLGLTLYLLVLFLIAIQNKIFRFKSLILANLELLFFLALFFFFFGGGRLFESQALITLFTLSLYLLGLWVFHYTSIRTESPCAEAFLELRMVIPFTLPFLLFTVFIDLFSLFPPIRAFLEEDSLAVSMALLGISVLFLALILIFFPPLLQWLWGCKPLQEGELKQRLDNLCRRAKFKHAGMRIWTVIPHAVTAAIIGVMAPFRYVMFTDRLLKELAPDSVEAVLAHEMGHSYHKHLILYPFVIFGMLACATLFSQFFSAPLAHYFSLQNLLYPSLLWETLYPLVIFIAYALIIALYFRLVFGFFSRLFERQADLHIFRVDVSSRAMKEGLLAVARSMGMPPTTPSWHHYSVQQRVDFLNRVEANPALIPKHHRKVKYYLVLYLLILGLINWLIFTANPDTLIDNAFNRSLREEIASQWIERYHLQGNRPLIENAIIAGLSTEQGMNVPGAAQYIASQLLRMKGEDAAADKLHSAAMQYQEKKNGL